MTTPAPRRTTHLRASGGLRSLAATAAGCLLALALAGPVVAHADLVSSDPADRAVLATPPTTITLTFTEPLDAAKSSFKLIGPGGTIGTGKVAGDPAGMMLDGLALDPGSYQVQWTSAGPDGHLERGTLAFTVSEPTPPPATPSRTPALADASAGASAGAAAAPAASPSAPVSASPAPGADPGSPTSSSGGDVLLPIVVALLVVAGAGILVLRRSRQA